MSGGRKETIDDDEILKQFVEADDPAFFTGEVADAFHFSNQGMILRLEDLEERGLLASKREGKIPIWWLTDDGRARVASDK